MLEQRFAVVSNSVMTIVSNNKCMYYVEIVPFQVVIVCSGLIIKCQLEDLFSRKEV